MKRFWISIVGICCLLVGCSDSSDDHPADPELICEPLSFQVSCASDHSYYSCVQNAVTELECPQARVCKQGLCVESCTGTDARCDQNVRVYCDGGSEKRETCENGCDAGKCKDKPATCSDTDAPRCDGDQRVTCVSGYENREKCDYGCENGACKPKSVDPPSPQTCDAQNFTPTCPTEHSYTACVENRVSEIQCASQTEICKNGVCAEPCTGTDAQCDQNVRVYCDGGIKKSETCDYGCEDGACKPKPVDPPAPGCGNGVLDSGEVCDGELVGDKTCADFVEKNMEQALYKGQPLCNDTCTEVEAGTCAVTFCGNNRLDFNMQVDEFCDIVNGEAKFRDPHTCDEIGGYVNVTWKEGGVPSCNSNCTGLSNGTCVLETQPLFGVERCAFTSFEKNEADKKMIGLARVFPTSSEVTYGLIHGKLACGHRDNPSYTWGFVESRFRECADCAEGEFELIADFSYETKSPGTYDCVFQIDIDDSALEGGSKSTEYVNCPLAMGYPHPQGKISVEEDVIRTYTVDEQPLAGTILASWDFSGYTKNDTATSIKANDGVMAAKSTVTLSDGSNMTMFTNGELSNLAASGDNWSTDPTLSLDNNKHFVLKTSTSGYKNIRLKYTVAGSGENTEKHIATAVNVLGVKTLLGDVLTFTEGKTYFMLSR